MTETLGAETWGMDAIDINSLSEKDIDFQWLPASFLQTHQILPLKNYEAVVSEPDNIFLFQTLSFYAKGACKIYLGHENLLKETRQRYLRSLMKPAPPTAVNVNPARENFSVIDYVETLFLTAIQKKASDIHLDTEDTYLFIRLRVDGLLYVFEKIPRSHASFILTHLKVLANLDITEKRLPQDGRFCITVSKKNTVDCRISTSPGLYEEKIVLRLLNTHTQPLNIHSLGFSEEQKKHFLAAITKPHGMILATGPTGSGKTVTLYTALSLLNRPEINILTIEDPVEIILPGMHQTPVHEKIDLTFARVLKAFLRQDPDILMVGEIRDKETASIAIKAAQTGHLILSTLHTGHAMETLSRLKYMGIPLYDVCSSVSLIIAQRLVRCLCAHCKIPDPLGKGYTAQGCMHCQQGYQGRTGIYEFLPMDLTLAEFILKHPHLTSRALEKKAREHGMETLRDHGQLKVNAGITSQAELSRVVHT